MFDHILSLLFPEHCYGCTRRGTALCSDCLNHIPWSMPVLEEFSCFALFDYGNATVQKIIWELKYHRKSAAAKVLALYGAPRIIEYLSSLLQTPVPMNIVLVPIPQHYTKTFSRGFNQSVLIAKWLPQALPETTIQSVLTKTRSTVAQARAHDRHEREKNLRHSMKASHRLDKNTLYILIDDVMTTGSTMREAGRALRAAGAKRICAIALAHGYAQRY